MIRAATATVQPVGKYVGEVIDPQPLARCHHSPHCLTPLQAGDLVIAHGEFFDLLDHAAVSTSRGDLAAGGVPRSL